jgi:hypothetical protein
MYIPQKSSENGRKQPVVPPLDAEELYRRYLSIRAERSRSGNRTDYTVTELKKADILGMSSEKSSQDI